MIVNNYLWGVSSAGRAFVLHTKGQEFDSPTLHQINFKIEYMIHPSEER